MADAVKDALSWEEADVDAFAEELSALLDKPGVAPGRRAQKQRRAFGLLLYALLVAAVLLAHYAADRGGAPRLIGGFSTLTVLTDSMQPEIPRGSFVLVRRVDADALAIGDDITYMLGREVSVTHRIVAIYENYEQGERDFETKGIDNDRPDERLVPARNVLGRVVFHVPYLGMATLWMQAHPLCAGAFALLPVLLVGALKWMFKKETPLEWARRQSTAAV